MISLLRLLLSNDKIRALVLKGARQLAPLVSGALVTLLVQRLNVSTENAAAIGTAVAGLVMAAAPAIASAIGTWLDYKSVGQQVERAKAEGAHQAVTLTASSPEAAAQLAAAANGGPQALAQTIAKLQAGTV